VSITSNRIAIKLADLQAKSKKALVPFITAGDPSKESTVAVMHGLVKGGADIIELGVPFSDPMADGPTIQRSSERALERGVNTNFVFECVKKIPRTKQRNTGGADGLLESDRNARLGHLRRTSGRGGCRWRFAGGSATGGSRADACRFQCTWIETDFARGANDNTGTPASIGE